MTPGQHSRPAFPTMNSDLLFNFLYPLFNIHLPVILYSAAKYILFIKSIE